MQRWEKNLLKVSSCLSSKLRMVFGTFSAGKIIFFPSIEQSILMYVHIFVIINQAQILQALYAVHFAIHAWLTTSFPWRSAVLGVRSEYKECTCREWRPKYNISDKWWNWNDKFIVSFTGVTMTMMFNCDCVLGGWMKCPEPCALSFSTAHKSPELKWTDFW
jgi:hypothetical protein